METTRHFTATTYVVYQEQVLLHWHKKINPFHQHIDLIYYARVNGSAQLAPDAEETTQLRWFTATDLAQTDMPVNVRVCALEALRLVNS
jgi:hypothetical protein